MQKFIDFLIWLFLRPWHIWVPLVLTLLVIGSANHWGKQAENIYKISSIAMQLIGVFVLLFLLNHLNQ